MTMRRVVRPQLLMWRRMPLQVLLVHGMARTPLSLVRLARELRCSGYAVHLTGYVAAFEAFDRMVARVHDQLLRLARGGEPYVAVGHSLGGLLLRAALAHSAPLPRLPRHLIMLGPPNQSPRLARRLQRLWPYRWINGDAGQRLADPTFMAAVPTPAVPYTIVAGTGGRRGRFSPFGSEPNDGTVAVSETRCLAVDSVIEVPVRHTFMMNDRRVRRVIRDVLNRVAA